MKTRILNANTIIIAIGALFGVLLLLHTYMSTETSPSIVVGDRRIPVSIADSEEERQIGLSNTKSLAQGTGKLFVFEEIGTYGFWMKDMSYPIDIVWVDQNYKVVSVTTITPESYPEVFYPSSEIKYVLELNSGEAKIFDLVPESKIFIKGYLES